MASITIRNLDDGLKHRLRIRAAQHGRSMEDNHKALFFNPGFVRYIPGVPKAESDYLVQFLTNHVSTASDFSVRFKWNAGDVAIWDNRTNIHSAIYEDIGVSRRHAIRVAVRGEIPKDSEDGTSREEEYYKSKGFQVDRTLYKGQRRQSGYKD